MIKSKKLSKIKTIKHGFFNKTGGKSKKIYESLNCGPGSKDNPLNVKKNLKIVKKKIKSTAKNIFLLHQIHSNKFVYISEKSKFKYKPKADAVVTNQKNVPIGILTADCVPILMCDEKKNIIAAIHAGWKGAYKDIISKVIKFMIKKDLILEILLQPLVQLSQLKITKSKMILKENLLKKIKRIINFLRQSTNGYILIYLIM